MLKRLKESLMRDSLRPPHQKGIRAFVKRKLNPRAKIPNRHMSIFLTTACNLNCFSCGALGMEPRPKVEHAQIKDIELFLGQMQEIFPGEYIMLTGGEPTLYPKLSTVCELIREYGFKTAMLTNGFEIVPVDWFDAIMIDYHGESNRTQIEEWQKQLKDSNIIWDLHDKRYHQDTEVAMNNNITKGLRCPTLFEPLTLWRDVIYPCCNIMCLEWWHEDDSTTRALVEAGWVVDNEGFPEIFKNWRDTLPPEFIKMCSLNCWRDSKIREWHEL